MKNSEQEKAAHAARMFRYRLDPKVRAKHNARQAAYRKKKRMDPAFRAQDNISMRDYMRRKRAGVGTGHPPAHAD